MTYLRILGAVILTVLLLRIARDAARGRSELMSHAENGVTLQMNSVTKAPENGTARVAVTMTGHTADLTPVLRYTDAAQPEAASIDRFRALPMTPFDSAQNTYSAQVSAGARGGRILYYVEVTDNTDNVKARMLHADGTPYVMKYFGNVPAVVLVTHIALMFITVFCVALAFMHTWRLVTGASDPRPTAFWYAAGFLFAFLGGLPLGIAVNHYAFGTTWEAVPFGTDATDNKTQLLLFYLLFTTLAMIGSLSRGKCGRDLFAPRTLGWLGVSAFLVMLGIYLVPHSIQFSKAFTYSVCYSFIGVVVLAYLVFLRRAARSRT